MQSGEAEYQSGDAERKIMSIELGLILSRMYMIIASILFVNLLSSSVFDHDHFTLKNFVVSAIFIPVWPLAIFSPSGRKAIFNRLQKI